MIDAKRDEALQQNDAITEGAAEEAHDATEESSRLSSFSRRALIHAGWTVPVILTVAPPKLFAQASPVHGDAHEDSHGDSHNDTGLQFQPQSDS